MKLSLATIVCALLLVGCGSAKTTSATHPAATTAAPKSASTPSAPSALQAEATAVAAGDIPDNQVFLVFTDAKAGYSMKYPEGWAQGGNAGRVTFRDKNNIVRVEVRTGGLPTVAQVTNDLRGTRVVGAPHAVTTAGRPALKVSYSTESAANPVTGKRVILVTDRYYLANGSKEAIVDLGTPQGVDNVDAYRLMIESFRWK